MGLHHRSCIETGSSVLFLIWELSSHKLYPDYKLIPLGLVSETVSLYLSSCKPISQDLTWRLWVHISKAVLKVVG